MAVTKKEYFGKVDLLYLLNLLHTELGNYVEAEDGKGLSANDFTDELLEKLNGIAEGAQVNLIEEIKLNGEALGIENKSVDIVLPVDDELSEESENAVQNKVLKAEFDKKANANNAVLTGIPVAPTPAEGTKTTQIATTAFVGKAVENAIGQITGLKFEKVTVLPETGKAGVIYLLPKDPAGVSNVYTEYYWDGEKFEILGDTTVDLSNYLQDTDVVEMDSTEVQAAWDSVFGS